MRAQRKLPRPQQPILSGADLREHRQRLGISQAVLAAQLHYSRSYVADMERGYRRIPFSLAKALFDLLSELQAEHERVLTTLKRSMPHQGT